jgi:transaldolase
MKPENLTIKLFADGAVLQDMKAAYDEKVVSGFTTNPTLMVKAGVTDYELFAKEVINAIPDFPLSFEVFSDDFESMEQEARIIQSWGSNVNIKIPITNTKGESTIPLIRKLSAEGLQLNVTAILTMEQIIQVVDAIDEDVPAIVSVFAGRIADTGVDPMPIMREAASLLKSKPKAELLWASTREVFNIMQAQLSGCHIITVPNDILKKLSMFGKDLEELSLDTVKMFYADAQKNGFKIIKTLK